jgi:hypothetical protein
MHPKMVRLQGSGYIHWPRTTYRRHRSAAEHRIASIGQTMGFHLQLNLLKQARDQASGRTSILILQGTGRNKCIGIVPACKVVVKSRSTTSHTICTALRLSRKLHGGGKRVHRGPNLRHYALALKFVHSAYDNVNECDMLCMCLLRHPLTNQIIRCLSLAAEDLFKRHHRLLLRTITYFRASKTSFGLACWNVCLPSLSALRHPFVRQVVRNCLLLRTGRSVVRPMRLVEVEVAAS